MIKYHKTNHPKWKWELTRDYHLQLLYRNGFDKLSPHKPVETEFIILRDWLSLGKGYAINGVNLLPDRKVWMRGAFVHDALWQLIELGKPPKSMVGVSNRIFRDIIAEDDNKLTAWIMYAGVQIGGLWRFKLKPMLKGLLK